MADEQQHLGERSSMGIMLRIASWLPLALPVFGGMAGIFLVKLAPEANPFLYVVAGVVLGKLLSYLLVKVIETRVYRHPPAGHWKQP